MIVRDWRADKEYYNERNRLFLKDDMKVTKLSLNQIITLHFFAQLNDFLPTCDRHKLFRYQLKEDASVKDIIESIGVPHVEVAMILVNDQSVGFHYQPQHGDQIGIYPHFKA